MLPIVGTVGDSQSDELQSEGPGCGVVHGFELLHAFGRVRLLSRFPEEFAVVMLGAYIVMVPGGLGTRMLTSDRELTGWLASWASSADLVTSVCTGSALLAAAGLLDGYRATSNKGAFVWASGHGDAVEWVSRARWVHDRDRWTSSGVAAGMDMTAALIAELLGPAEAARAADEIELELHTVPNWDPVTLINGLA